VSVLAELEDFKQAFIELLKKSKEIIDSNKRHPYHPTALNGMKRLQVVVMDEIPQAVNRKAPIKEEIDRMLKSYQNAIQEASTVLLVKEPISIFYMVADIIFYRSVVKWSEQITDMETLAQLYAVVYSKLAQIHLELSKFIKSTVGTALLSMNIDLIAEGRKERVTDLTLTFDTYRTVGMDAEIRKVIHTIQKIDKETNILRIGSLYARLELELEKVSITAANQRKRKRKDATEKYD